MSPSMSTGIGSESVEDGTEIVSVSVDCYYDWVFGRKDNAHQMYRYGYPCRGSYLTQLMRNLGS